MACDLSVTTKSRQHNQKLFGMIAVLATIGVLFLGWLVWREDRALRGELLRNALLSVQAVDKAQLELLPFDATDRSRPEFQQVGKQLRRYVSMLQLSWPLADGYIDVYSMRQRNGKIVFGPESIPEGDRRASPPASVYQQPPSKLLKLFASRQPDTIGPFTDESGTFVSAFVPLPDSPSGMVIGMKVMADKWFLTILQRVALPSSGMLLIVFTGIAVLITRRLRAGQEPALQKNSSRIWLYMATTLILALGFGGGITYKADFEMRRALLLQARLVAQTLDIDRIHAFSGTESDLIDSEYQRLKKQLAVIREATPRCRFVYLIGRKSDGAMFFYVDSEPVGSSDYSPPGQPFDEASAEFKHIFDTRIAITEGPVTDRWGTWISALFPLSDPQDDLIFTVLGMDIAAYDWKWEVAAEAALPLGLMCVLLIGVIIILFTMRRVSVAPKPVLYRMFTVFASLLLLLVGGFVWVLFDMQQARINEVSRMVEQEAQNDIDKLLQEHKRSLGALQETIIRDEGLLAALKAGDRKGLLAAYRPLLDQLKNSYGVTHFAFSDTNRVCVLRVHEPEKFGDRFDRFTTREAERTGEIASGLELGPRGTLAFRVVRPVFDSDRRIGYFELGKELEEILKSLNNIGGVQKVSLLCKNVIDRAQWEAGMRRLGLEENWDYLPDHVINYSSMPLTEKGKFLIRTAWHAYNNHMDEIQIDNKSWRVTMHSLKDATGQKVGELLMLDDITTLHASQNRLLTVTISGVGVLLSALLGLVFVLLRRADRNLLAQQRELRESKDRFEQLAEQTHAITWEVDAKGLFTFVSPVVEQVLGYQPEELVGKKYFYDLHPEDGREAFKTGAFEVFGNKQHFLNLINSAQSKTGEILWVRTNGLPILDEHGTLTGYRGSDTDITDSKLAEEKLTRMTDRLALAVQAGGVGI